MLCGPDFSEVYGGKVLDGPDSANVYGGKVLDGPDSEEVCARNVGGILSASSGASARKIKTLASWPRRVAS